MIFFRTTIAMPQTQRTSEADLTPKTSQAMNLSGLQHSLPSAESRLPVNPPESMVPGPSMMSIIRDSLARTAQAPF